MRISSSDCKRLILGALDVSVNLLIRLVAPATSSIHLRTSLMIMKREKKKRKEIKDPPNKGPSELEKNPLGEPLIKTSETGRRHTHESLIYPLHFVRKPILHDQVL